MQEKLARLHFSLDVCGEEEDEEEEEDGVTEGLPEEQKKTMADRNLDQLLSNVGHRASFCGSRGTPRAERAQAPKSPSEKLGVHEPKSMSSPRSTSRTSPEHSGCSRSPLT